MFRLAAAGFPANINLGVTINNQYVGSVPTTADGYAVFHVVDNSSLSGNIPVAASFGGASASLTINFTQSGALHAQEGSGQLIPTSTTLTFLPRISR